MGYVLGLDIGSNSIGWAIISNYKIIDLGIRIFPVGVKEDSYSKSGTEESKNSSRRSARGIRRLYARYKLRRKQLKKFLFSIEMIPPESSQLTSRQLYQFRKKALDEQIPLQEIGRIFLLLNQRRGFKSNKKGDGKGEQKKELDGIKQEMAELEQKVADADCRTIGEYFALLFEKQSEKENWHNPDEPVERIRKRFVFRKAYEKEFDLIWAKQKTYYPAVLTDENYKKIKDNCIFYQRPLKSQKHLVAKCRFEPSKRVAPKSSFEFQEFRIWQFIGNLRISGGNRFRESLSLDEKTKLGLLFQENELITHQMMKNALNLPKSYTFQKDIPLKIKGNTTNAKLMNALGEKHFNFLSNEEKYKLWHTLYFANDEEWLIKYAETALKLNSEQTKKYASIALEEEYGNVSIKAIRKILPLMKIGFDYAQACEEAGYHHSYDEETDSAKRELSDLIVRDKKDDLRNPLVQQAVSETIRLVNEILKERGKPQSIRVEFARMLKMPKDKRENIKRANDEKEARRESYRGFLSQKLGMNFISRSDILKFELWLEMEFNETDLKNLSQTIDAAEFRKFSKNVKPGDKTKYALWLECGRISPYSGKIISLGKLFSSEIEVEHIIPYSRCLNDSFGNKTLCEKEINADKANKTPYEYFAGRPNEWASFLNRVKHFSEGKQIKFTIKEIPSDFISQQLNNTAYIAKEARKKLKTVCRDVTVTNGQATSKLRHLWGLNTILNQKGENKKSRHDHRHHAVDALVIAATTPAFIKLLSDKAQFDNFGNLTLKDAPPPFPEFRDEAVALLSTVLISYRNKKRLLTTKTNKYIHSRSKIDTTQKSISVRGTLHNETFFGKIFNPETKEHNYVIRTPITNIKTQKNIEDIVDPAIRHLIIEHIAKHNGNITEAMASELFMVSKDGKKKIPVKKVRMIQKAGGLIQLRPTENEKLFVAPGSNYLIALYEKDGKRAYETVSFFEAAQLKLKGQIIYPAEKNGKPFLFSLVQKDLVLVYDKHPDEIDWDDKKKLFESLYLVRKFDTNGNIAFVLHNLTNVDPNKPKEYPKEWVMRKTFNSLKAVKVRISLTGKIIRL